MAAKLFPCLIGLLSLLVLFPTESDAFANGGNSGIPGKRALEELSDFQVSTSNAMSFVFLFYLLHNECDLAVADRTIKFFLTKD